MDYIRSSCGFIIFTKGIHAHIDNNHADTSNRAIAHTHKHIHTHTHTHTHTHSQTLTNTHKHKNSQLKANTPYTVERCGRVAKVVDCGFTGRGVQVHAGVACNLRKSLEQVLFKIYMFRFT